MGDAQGVVLSVGTARGGIASLPVPPTGAGWFLEAAHVALAVLHDHALLVVLDQVLHAASHRRRPTDRRAHPHGLARRPVTLLWHLADGRRHHTFEGGV